MCDANHLVPVLPIVAVVAWYKWRANTPAHGPCFIFFPAPKATTNPGREKSFDGGTYMPTHVACLAVTDGGVSWHTIDDVRIHQVKHAYGCE